MSDRAERPAARGSMTSSDRDESPSPGHQSPSFQPQYPPAILDLINTFQGRVRLDSGPNTSRTERAAVQPSTVRPGPSSEAVATQSIELPLPESFEVPIMLDDPTHRPASDRMLSPGSSSIRLPVSLSPTSIPLPESPLPAETPPVTVPSPNTVSPTRGTSFASRFGQPGSSSSPAPWPEGAVPYSPERMLEAWLIRQQLLVGIPIDQLQPMTTPGRGRTHRTPPWIIITPEGAHIVAIPPARFHGVMQPIPRVPWLPAPSTALSPPPAPTLAAPIVPEVSTISATSTSSVVSRAAAERNRNMRSALEMHHRLAISRLAESVSSARINPHAASPTLSVPSGPTIDLPPREAEVRLRSPGPVPSSLSPVVLNPTLAVRSVSSGSSTMRNPRSVRPRAPSPELPASSVPPGVLTPRMTLRTTPASSTMRDPRPRPTILHASAPTSSISSAPLFAVLNPRLAARRPPGFSLSASRDPRPRLTHCRLTNTAIFSGHLLTYPPRPSTPRPAPINPARGSSRTPDAGSRGGVNQTDNASRERSTPAGDIPLQVTRAVSDDASNIHRQTPFGGGDGCWAPIPTLDLLDNEIGKDGVLPGDTQTPEEISTSQVKWFPCRPPTNPYFSVHSRVVWSISNHPMEPLFMEVLTDNLGVLGLNPAGEGLTLNLFPRDGSDRKNFFASNPEFAEKALPSPNEDAIGDSSFSLGDPLVRIFEIFALIADHLTGADLESLAITSTGLRKFVWGYMTSWFLEDHAPQTRTEMQVFLFQSHETQRNSRKHTPSPHWIGWHRWEEPIPIAYPWTTWEVRCLLSSGIDFVQYPVYCPVRFAHINFNSFAPSSIQRWELVPLDILTNDEYARRQLDSSHTLEVYEAPGVNDSLYRANEMQQFLSEQCALPN
ncbi:hypothetical protein PENARI_c002G04454 [Penicillium arizonense]|uniref:Uncharacterized protein n=1 Tax=Penicillium arizonense TaxID=1835702 RepID=A0A1F5LUE5_PENAI|nr:hypothetical protein PENARI_c002G04454 [Penicillium arizonense]OGE56787.1 hypothetical protein PENARI_c002G04454 [Penicillium arizonense]